MVVPLILELGCSFSGPGAGPGDGNETDAGDDTPDSSTATDAMPCWPYTPANFDPCDLAEQPQPLIVDSDTSVDTDALGLPNQILTQADGTQVAVVHLSELTVQDGNTLRIGGSLPVIFAVEGAVTIAGTVTTAAGIDNPIHCGCCGGATGIGSNSGGDGGGGGGGGGAHGAGGPSGAGDGGNAGAGQAAAGAASGAGTLIPLRAGCSGGPGGDNNGGGTVGAGGAGGGAVQISGRATVTISGDVFAIGSGGGGGGPRTGGGGGGSGGAILIEASTLEVTSSSTLCADGGSGGEGGGGLNGGASGSPGQCNGTSAAGTTEVTVFGGTGGDGSFAGDIDGQPAGSSTGDGGGGGGGGGGAGWIRVRGVSMQTVDASATITPDLE